MTSIAKTYLRRAIPLEHRSNFLHLYFDIAWFGVLSGSALSFITVYLVRLGATAFQVGLVNSGSPLMAILLALPAGWWLKNRPLDGAVFWASVWFRFFYLFWIPLPVLFAPQHQVWLITGLTLLMSIPGTALAVGFNALFADVVPPEWRDSVVGVRNALLALTFTLTSFLSGYLLSSLPFPMGYQAVFALGFLGALMSSLHLRMVRLDPEAETPPRMGRSLGDLAHPGFFRSLGDALRPGVGLRFLMRRLHWSPSFAVLRGAFGPILLSLFAFHLTQHLAIPLYPVYFVEQLNLSDQSISLGNALFYSFFFLGSTQTARLTRQLGLYRATVFGALLLSVYPGMVSIARGLGMYLATSIVGGLFSALVGAAMGNYLLERIPEDERSTYLAWYTLLLNGAVLLGSLMGPLWARYLGLVPALVLIAAGRVFSALAIWRWGR